MRVLVCGGRNFYSYPIVQMVLDRIKIEEICHGGAVGTDSLAGAYAKANDIPCQVFPADWDKIGRAARYARNVQMFKEFNPDIVVAFPGGVGTAHMVKHAIDKGCIVLTYNDKGQLDYELKI